MSDRHPLASVFLGSRPPAAAASGADPVRSAALEASLVHVDAQGRAAWPSVKVASAAFVRYLAERARSADPVDLRRLHAADLYLACACAGGDASAVAAFDRQYLAPLPQLLARKGTALDVADEAVQSLRERFFVATKAGRARIGDYDGRGSLAGWVRVAAVRAASNLRRAQGHSESLPDDDASPAALLVIDPELALIKRRYGDAFQTALRDAFAALAEEERNVLRLHFGDGLNLEAIARVLGLSRATVGRRMITGRARVLEETLRLLGERLTATPTELLSLLGVVRSKLDVSLGALARST